MNSPMFQQNGRRDSKRFDEEDFETIKNKGAFYAPVY